MDDRDDWISDEPFSDEITEITEIAAARPLPAAYVEPPDLDLWEEDYESLRGRHKPGEDPPPQLLQEIAERIICRQIAEAEGDVDAPTMPLELLGLNLAQMEDIAERVRRGGPRWKTFGRKAE